MANTSYLSAVNAVLIRLRESTVSTVIQTAYSTLIGAFVNEAKDEVEDSWNWNQLSSSLTVPMVIGQRNYTLTGTTGKTRILDAYNTTAKWRMRDLGSNEYINRILAVTATQNASPLNYDLYNFNSTTGEMVIRVNPVPTGTDSIIFYLSQPQDPLAVDGTLIQVPVEPVIQLAYLKAINERGEDNGRASEIQEKLYLKLLNATIARDAARNESETVWQAV